MQNLKKRHSCGLSAAQRSALSTLRNPSLMLASVVVLDPSEERSGHSRYTVMFPLKDQVIKTKGTLFGPTGPNIECFSSVLFPAWLLARDSTEKVATFTEKFGSKDEKWHEDFCKIFMLL